MTVLDRVRQSYCALHGHDNLLQFEPERLYLKCVSCEHESPGWEITRAIVSELQPGARQLRLVMPMFEERRAA